MGSLIDGVAGEQSAVLWALIRAVGSSYLEVNSLCVPMFLVLASKAIVKLLRDWYCDGSMVIC